MFTPSRPGLAIVSISPTRWVIRVVKGCKQNEPGQQQETVILRVTLEGYQRAGQWGVICGWHDSSVARCTMTICRRASVSPDFMAELCQVCHHYDRFRAPLRPFSSAPLAAPSPPELISCSAIGISKDSAGSSNSPHCQHARLTAQKPARRYWVVNWVVRWASRSQGRRLELDCFSACGRLLMNPPPSISQHRTSWAASQHG